MKLTDEQLSEIFGLRMVVLLESEPQSDKYRQVVLNADQFLALSNAFGEIMEEKVNSDNLREGTYLLQEEEITLPDWVQDYYNA
jgi:hypothetical protein